MPTEVHLIGEMHLDLQLGERYERAWTQLRPDAITTELDAERETSCLDEFKEIFRQLKTKGCNFTEDSLEGKALAGVFAQNVYFARRYQKKTTAKVIYADDLSELLIGLRDGTADTNTENNEVWEGYWTTQDVVDRIIQRIANEQLMKSLQRGGLIFEGAVKVALLANVILQGAATIREKNMDLSAIYYLTKEELSDTDVITRRRDDYAIKKIMECSGKVVHCGGIGHIFGNYDNLYEKLRRQGIPVTRHKLVEFEQGGHLTNIEYQQAVRRMAGEFEQQHKLR